MKIKDRKGVILIIAIFFIIVMAIVSVSMYHYVNDVFLSGVKRIENIKGFYANIAALRYAKLLVGDSSIVSAGDFFSDPPENEHAVLGTEISGLDFYADTGLPSGRLTVTIKKVEEDGLTTEYDMSSTYSHSTNILLN